ncbi:MAG: cyclic peptide export ABC transporter [Proteobacteria bacterium]|nr:cyclic peptide export ABC transporter [Pseudomonadota bacterium]
MSFFQLVRREMETSLNRLVIVSSLGGVSSASILAAINAGAQAADNGAVSLRAAFFFIIALILFIQTQHYVLITTTAEIEAIIHRVRVRLMDYVRRSELLPLEAIGRAEIVAAITRETATLTQASIMLAFSVQGALLITFVIAYVAFLSLLAFGLSVVIVGIGAAVFHAKTRQLAIDSQEATLWENRLFDRLSDLLDGFKEVRLNHARSDELYRDIVEVSRAAANIKIRTQSETFKRMVLLQSSLYTMLGTVAFVVPNFSETVSSGSITKTITALVFIVAACFGLVQSIPVILRANASAESIVGMEVRLRETVAAIEALPGDPAKRFNMIEMRDVEFSYTDKSSDSVFKVGPINFTLRSGELVFITGGNGSGKSTFFKLLAGLYQAQSGQISFDGTPVSNATREAYRGMIAAIFPDFHLFLRLYGIEQPDHTEVDRLLAQFRLLDKTRLADGEFRTVDLSSGQRKRLALIVSLLEKRPILLLDEWAADQDPEFRRKFYFELLPALNQSGVTVVAISHDDRYIEEMEAPARRLHMDEGRLVEVSSTENG